MSVYNPDKQRAERAWFKERGICVSCRRERAFGHFTMCPGCLERNAQRAAEYREANPERSREASRRRYWKCKAEGRCINCGKANPDAGVNCRCPSCVKKSRICQKARRVWKVKPEDICRICDQPVHPGKKLCYEHWVISRERMLAIRPENDRHPWRRDETARLMSVWHTEENKEESNEDHQGGRPETPGHDEKV